MSFGPPFQRAYRLCVSLWSPTDASSLRQRFASNATWSLASSVISRGMGLAASIVAARILGLEQYGEFGLIRSTVVTLGVIAGYGIGLTATKYVAEFMETDPDRTGRTITLVLDFTLVTSLIAALIMWLCADWIVGYLSLPPTSVGEIGLAAPLLILNALWSVLQATLIGFQGFRELTINNLVYGFLAFFLTLIFTYSLGLSGAIIALSLSAAVGAIFAGREVVATCRGRSISLFNGIRLSDIRILWRFGLPAYFSGIIVMPVLWWAYAQIASKPGGTAQMGLFNAADQWRNMILFVPQALAAVVLPMLTTAYAHRNRHSFQRVLLLNVLLVVALGAAMLAIFYVFRDLILVAYGRDFLDGATVMLILAVTGVVQSVGTIVGQSMYSLSKMSWAILQNAAWGAVILIGMTFVFESSALGLAYSLLAAYTVMTIISCLFVYYYVIRDKNGAMMLGVEGTATSN